MKLTNTQINQVHSYVRNEMNDKDRSDFEKIMLINPELRAEVEFESSILSASKLVVIEENMKQARITNLLTNKTSHPQYQTIQHNFKRAREINKSKKNQYKKYLVLGISTMLMLSIIGIGLYENQDDRLRRSFITFNDSLDDTLSESTIEFEEVSGNKRIIGIKLNHAKTALLDKEWDKAIKICEELNRQYKYNSDQTALYTSIALHHKNQFEKSITLLESHVSDEGAFACHLQHFLILAYLNSDEATKAKNTYQVLQSNLQTCDKNTLQDLNQYF